MMLHLSIFKLGLEKEPLAVIHNPHVWYVFFETDHQVDKLKVLSESLASSIGKAEKRISDNRYGYALDSVILCSVILF